MNTVVTRSNELFNNRRLRRTVLIGPRCPDCTGPLVHGEGCNLCPVCGYSGCSTSIR